MPSGSGRFGPNVVLGTTVQVCPLSSRRFAAPRQTSTIHVRLKRERFVTDWRNGSHPTPAARTRSPSLTLSLTTHPTAIRVSK